MELSKEQNDAVDRLRAVVENERASAKIRDLLDEALSAETFQTAADDLRQTAESIQEKVTELETEAQAFEDAASTVETAVDRSGAALEAFEGWEGAEGRDEKREARENLFAVLQELIEAVDEVATLEVVELDEEEDEEDEELSDKGIDVRRTEAGGKVFYEVVLEAGPEGGPYNRWVTPFGSLKEANDMARKLGALVSCPTLLLKPTDA